MATTEATYLLDSCSHYAAADVGRKYIAVDGTPGLVDGRSAGRALSFDGGGNDVELEIDGRTFRYATWGASVYVHSSGWGAATSIALVQMIADDTDGGGAYRYEMTQLRVTAAGALAVSDPTTALAQSADGALAFDTWHFVEVAVNYANAAGDPLTGQVGVRVDGTDVAAASGVTPAPGVAPASRLFTNRIRYGNQDGGNAVRVDLCDVYAHCYETTLASGDAFASLFLGYKPVRAYLPTRYVATATPFTPVGAATNLECVSEAEGDGDATYLLHPAGATTHVDNYYFDGATAANPGTNPWHDRVGNNTVDFVVNACLAILARSETANAAVRSLTLGVGGGSTQAQDLQLPATYTYVRGETDVLPPSFARGWTIQSANSPALRVSHFVLEARVGGGATWVAWIGT